MTLLHTSLTSKTTLFLTAAILSVSALAADFNQTQYLADQGDAEAQYNLGLMYDTGKGVHQDYAKAVEWYQKAAVQRNPELAVQRAAQEVAGAEVDIAKSEWLPSVSANIDKSYGRGSGSFSDTRVSNRRINDAGKVGFSITQFIPMISIFTILLYQISL